MYSVIRNTICRRSRLYIIIHISMCIMTLIDYHMSGCASLSTEFQFCSDNNI